MTRKIITPLALTIILAITYLFTFKYRDSFLDIEEKIKQYMLVGGAPVVLLLSMLENIVIINAFIPAAIVILTAMSLTAGNLLLALKIYLSIVVGSYIGQSISYYLGQRASSKVDQISPSLYEFLGTFWHPQLGSITSLKSGEAKMPLFTFYYNLSIATIPWSIFWGVLMYVIGNKLSMTEQLLPLALIYTATWLLYALIER